MNWDMIMLVLGGFLLFPIVCVLAFLGLAALSALLEEEFPKWYENPEDPWDEQTKIRRATAVRKASGRGSRSRRGDVSGMGPGEGLLTDEAYLANPTSEPTPTPRTGSEDAPGNEPS